MKAKLLTLVCLMVLSACSSYPNSSVEQGGDRPSLVLQGGDENSVLILDGITMGSVSNFDGKPNKLLIEPGRHSVSIVDSQQNILYQTSIYVSHGQVKVVEIGE